MFKCEFELWFSFSLVLWLNRCITAFRHQMLQKVFAPLLFFLSWTDQSISLPAGQGRGYYCMHSTPSVICLWSIKTKENWSRGQKVIFSHLRAIPPGVFMCCYQFMGKLHEYSCITKWPCAPLVIGSNKWFKGECREDIYFADKLILLSSQKLAVIWIYISSLQIWP